jgi:hypothetical protein
MFDPEVFKVEDNTMIHLISQSEDYLIGRRNDIIDWFSINEKWEQVYKNKLTELNINLDENTCIINFRGGEYRSIPNLIARREYWSDSIKYMKSINQNMRFIIITDDEQCAKYFIGDYTCIHIDIGFDFYCINKSKYTILSNSSFGYWASWLNTDHRLIIAPKFWSQHNVSDGYWGLGDQYVRHFMYMDREGNLSNFETCKVEALDYYKKNNLI